MDTFDGTMDGQGANDQHDGINILDAWRLEQISKSQETEHAGIKPPDIHVLPEELNWPDDLSKEAELELRQGGVRVPWHFNDFFGDEFRVQGLRTGKLGAVLIVESTHLRNKFYAAKTLRPFLRSDYLKMPEYKQQRIAQDFLHEALLWLEMGQHPNIVAVHLLRDIVHPTIKKKVPFVFSEYMEKGDLKRLIEQRGRFSLGDTLSIALQVCEGLLHGYKHGLEAHKDLKPENIMVYRDSIYKVTDFSAGVLGTPGYMAPEQIAQIFGLNHTWTITHRADQFAIGIILLETITGNNPFREQLRKAAYAKDEAERLLNSGLGEIVIEDAPDPIRLIIDRCLSLNPAYRFQDLMELKNTLLQIHKSELGREYNYPQSEVDDSAEWWFNRGNAFYNIGRHASAVTPYREAFRRYEAMQGTGKRQADCLANLGVVYESTAKLSEAETCLKEALAKYVELPGTEIKRAECLANIGNVYIRAQELHRAEEMYRKALSILENNAGTEEKQASCLMNLGAIYSNTGKVLESRKMYIKAILILRDLSGTELSQARCLMMLGNLHRDSNELLEAEQKYKQAMHIFVTIPGSDVDKAKCLLNWGSSYLQGGNYFESEEKYNEALAIFKVIPGTDLSQARCLEGIGHIYKKRGMSQEAKQKYRAALEIYEELPNTETNQAVCLLILGELYIQDHEYDEANKVLIKALSICDQHYHGTEQIRKMCLDLLEQFPKKRADEDKTE